MSNQKDRTLEAYMRAGADMRLYKTLGIKLLEDMSRILSPSDYRKLLWTMEKIEKIRSLAYDNMISDYPDLSEEYVSVFYGITDSEPGNNVDEKIIGMAREAADGLFKGKRD